MDAGENVFQRLDDNADRVEQLVNELLDQKKKVSPSQQQQQQQQQQPLEPTAPPPRTDQILAASALCQLGDTGSGEPSLLGDNHQSATSYMYEYRSPCYTHSET